MFGRIGPEKIVLLVVVVLLLFGAKRIPEIGSSFGKGIRDFKKSLSDDQGDDATPRADLQAPARETEAPAPRETTEPNWRPRRLGQ